MPIFTGMLCLNTKIFSSTMNVQTSNETCLFVSENNNNESPCNYDIVCISSVYDSISPNNLGIFYCIIYILSESSHDWVIVTFWNVIVCDCDILECDSVWLTMSKLCDKEKL